jgi:pyruvate kinase
MSQNQDFKNTHHKTKIVATVGPACDSYDQLKKLVIAGVNVFRLNFSHGSHEDKKQIIDHIRGINEELGCSVAILGDLQGPKLRVGEIEDGKVDQHEASFKVGKKLKEIYIDSALKKSDKLDNEHGTTTPEKVIEKTINWSQWKKANI